MTSNISLSNLCKENLKHRTALILISCFYFLVQILVFVMSIQNKLADDDILPSDLPAEILSLSLPNMFFVVAAIALALLSVFIGFKFLHSKTQTDFYGSLPVKRSSLFVANFIDDVAVFAIPMAISTVIEGIIVSAMGYGSQTLIHNLFASFLVMFVAFLLTWVTAVLAMVMTGHSFIALLGFGVFATYAPLVLRFLFPSYAATFFHTYVLAEGGSKLNYFSPVSLAYCLSQNNGPNAMSWLFRGHISHLIGSLILFVVVGAIAYSLYLRRPAESAGNAMAFPKANPVIEFLLVIPMALYAGVYLSELSLQKSTTWLFIGIVLGVLLFHATIECIFAFDIHALFHHKKQLLVSGVFCLVFAICFLFDIFGYDHYLPKRDKIQTFNMTIDDYWQPSYDDLDEWNLAKNGLSSGNTDKALSMIRNCQDDTITENFTDQQGDSIDKSYLTVNVSYTLKNGSLRKRRFNLNRKKCISYLDSIYSTEDFKNDIYPLYQLKNDVTDVSYTPNGCYEKSLNLSQKEMKEFITTYLSELSSATYSYESSTTPVGELSFDVNNAVSRYVNDEDALSSYAIYPSFKKTIAFLEKKQISVPKDATHIFDNADTPDISTIEITEYDDDYNQIASYQIEDQKIIDRYKNKLIPIDFSRDSMSAKYDITVYFKAKATSEDDLLSCYADKKTIETLLSHAKKIDTSKEY